MSSRIRCRLLGSALVLAGPALAALGQAAPPASEPFALPCEGIELVERGAAAGLDFQHRRGAAGDKHLPETMGAGLAWLDFDGDGWLDLYVVQSGPFPPDGEPEAADRLFRSLGDGRFEAVSEARGASHRGYGQGVVAADVEGDGDLDLYLSTFGRDALLENLGDGTFRESAVQRGLGAAGWSSSVALADGDGDGDLDLYLTRYLEYDPDAEIYCGDVEAEEREYCDPSLFVGAADLYYRNLGGGRFQEVTAEMGLEGARGRGLGVLFTDLDGDRWPDLYVANDLTLNLLYRNREGEGFEDLSLLSGAAVNHLGKAEAGMGLAVGDVDGDGTADLAVTNFDVETNTLYRNLGELQFEDISAPSGFGTASFNLLGFGLTLADLDLDGDLDAWAANGHIFEEPKRDNVAYKQPDLLLLGDGRGRFAAQPCGVLATGPEVARGLATADYDNDGTLDLAVSHSDGPLALFENRTASERWLGVELLGGGANSQAVGAQVTLITEKGRQVRWVVAGDSYQSSSDRRLLFAWPEGDSPRALDIRWPDGGRQRLAAPAAGAYLRVAEPQS